MREDSVDIAAEYGLETDADVREVETLAMMTGLIDELAFRRKQADLSQQDVADRMGTSQAAVAKLEGHRHDPRMTTLVRYATAVGVDARGLIDILAQIDRADAQDGDDGAGNPGDSVEPETQRPGVDWPTQEIAIKYLSAVSKAHDVEPISSSTWATWHVGGPFTHVNEMASPTAFAAAVAAEKFLTTISEICRSVVDVGHQKLYPAFEGLAFIERQLPTMEEVTKAFHQFIGASSTRARLHFEDQDQFQFESLVQLRSGRLWHESEHPRIEKTKPVQP